MRHHVHLVLGVCALVAAFIITSMIPASAQQALSREDVREQAMKLNIQDRIWLIEQLKPTIRHTMLDPGDDWRTIYTDYNTKEKGLCRILERGKFEDFEVGDIRGGGAYWSFTERSNSYNDDPQLELTDGRFKSGFYGGNVGVIARLEVASIREVEFSDVPKDLTNVEHYSRSEHKRELKDLENEYGHPDAELGQVYALRCVNWKESDVLVAFEVLQRDENGVTLVWKLLKTYPTPKE